MRAGPRTAAAMKRMPAKGMRDFEGTIPGSVTGAPPGRSRPQRGQKRAASGADFEQDVQRWRGLVDVSYHLPRRRGLQSAAQLRTVAPRRAVAIVPRRRLQSG